MESTAIVTMVKMMEQLPSTTQEQLVEHVRQYLADLEDEMLWDEQFAQSQPQLIAAAQKARQQRQAGQAHPLTFDQP